MRAANLQPLDLLKSAKDLVQSSNNKPRQSNLLRATSTTYYALFHTLARCCADTVIGGHGASISKPAWAQVYRALEHRSCKNSCKNGGIQDFPQEIQDFADRFVTMQDKRHTADYDPNAKVFKSSVMIDIEQAEAVIGTFKTAPIKDRRAFAAFVLFKRR